MVSVRRKNVFVFRKAHVVIVPTTSQFEEGFAKICAEAILAERPVVTSAVCPALASIREAAIEVPPDNVEAYFQAIVELANDEDFTNEIVWPANHYKRNFTI